MVSHPLARRYLKKPPELIIVDDAAFDWDQRMSALVKCQRIVQVSSGLIENLEPTELKFIIGHELGHLIRGDQHPQNSVWMTALSRKLNQRSERMADQIGVLLSGASAECAKTALNKAISLHTKEVEKGLDWMPQGFRDYIVGSITRGSRTYPSLQSRFKLIDKAVEDSQRNPDWATRVLQDRLDQLHERLQ